MKITSSRRGELSRTLFVQNSNHTRGTTQSGRRTSSSPHRHSATAATVLHRFTFIYGTQRPHAQGTGAILGRILTSSNAAALSSSSHFSATKRRMNAANIWRGNTATPTGLLTLAASHSTFRECYAYRTSLVHSR